MTGRRNLYSSKVDFRFVEMSIPFGGFFVFVPSTLSVLKVDYWK